MENITINEFYSMFDYMEEEGGQVYLSGENRSVSFDTNNPPSIVDGNKVLYYYSNTGNYMDEKSSDDSINVLQKKLRAVDGFYDMIEKGDSILIRKFTELKEYKEMRQIVESYQIIAVLSVWLINECMSINNDN